MSLITNAPIIVLNAVIKTQRGIILIQRSQDDSYMPGVWEFPGGKFEGGYLKSNLRREVKEETSLVGVSFSGLGCIYTTIEEGSLGKYFGRHIICHYFFGEKKNNVNIHLSHEHQGQPLFVTPATGLSHLPLRISVLEVLQIVFKDYWK